MADLVSLSRFKTATGKFPDPTIPDPADGQFQGAIAAASELVRSYTGMEFILATGPAATPTTRQFEYDGTGWLDVGEVQNITAVTQQGYYAGAVAWTVDQYSYRAYPLNKPVKRWLVMPRSVYGISPEMGFTYNLDTLAAKYGIETPSIVNVTGVWGWPSIPEDVQQAVIWTTQSMIDSPNTYQSESIEGYSRTKAFSSADDDPIPPKARAALSSYIVPNI